MTSLTTCIIFFISVLLTSTLIFMIYLHLHICLACSCFPKTLSHIIRWLIWEHPHLIYKTLINFPLRTVNQVSSGICQLRFRDEGCYMKMRSNLSLSHVELRLSVGLGEVWGGFIYMGDRDSLCTGGFNLHLDGNLELWSLCGVVSE